jgi:hypothetical protein
MKEQDSLFSKKHATLWRISMWANGLAPIVIFIFILLAFDQIFQYNTVARTQYQTDLLGLISREPIYILDVLLQMARVFLQGVVYYVTLKGVALGLDMLVETDINYRENKKEGDKE